MPYFSRLLSGSEMIREFHIQIASSSGDRSNMGDGIVFEPVDSFIQHPSHSEILLSDFGPTDYS